MKSLQTKTSLRCLFVANYIFHFFWFSYYEGNHIVVLSKKDKFFGSLCNISWYMSYNNRPDYMPSVSMFALNWLLQNA